MERNSKNDNFQKIFEKSSDLTRLVGGKKKRGDHRLLNHLPPSPLGNLVEIVTGLNIQRVFKIPERRICVKSEMNLFILHYKK